MTVCVVGSGAREHALALAIARSEDVVVTPGNPGTEGRSPQGHLISRSALAPVDIFAELFVIGPEQPLVDGLADELRSLGRLVLGPGSAGAQLEGSKAFMKQLSLEAGVPTARFGVFDEYEPARAFLRSLPGPYVVKTDGLASGKGVLVTEELGEALLDVEAKLSGRSFGEAGRKVVIEQALQGPELSLHVLTDGRRVVPLPPAQDYKRLADGDEGPNTGGMGAFSPVPAAPDAVLDEIVERLVEPALARLRRLGIEYRGVLYAGCMLTDHGPQLLEFNVRFGDPEAEVVLARVSGDVAALCRAAAEGRARDLPQAPAGAAVCVVQAAPGYPESPSTGAPIDGLDQAGTVEGVTVFQAGTARGDDGVLRTAGGRVLAVTGTAADLATARQRAYAACELVGFDGVQYRKDIATGALGVIPRYSLPEMAALWTDHARLARWLEIEVLAAEALAKLGVLDPAHAEAIRERAPQVDEAFVRAVEAREEVTDHDVAAFVDVVQERIGGPAGAFVHYGLTSSDVVDTATSVALVRSADLLIDAASGLVAALASRAREHADTAMLGRTHGIHAEPTTFGAKLALFALQLDRDRERLRRARSAVAVGKLSGAVGTYSNVEPAVEEYVCAALGLTPVPASQVVARDRHAEYLYACASVGASVEALATELRLLQQSELAETEEPFGAGQKGSSSMPHKRNPITSERLTGIARLLRAGVGPGLEDVALWHERDISHSSVERVVLPDSSLLAYYALRRATLLVAGLVVRAGRMRENLTSNSLGLVFSQPVLLALVAAGISRDAAYRVVQSAARLASTERKPFRQVLEADQDLAGRLGPGRLGPVLDEAFDLERSLRHAGRAIEALDAIDTEPPAAPAPTPTTPRVPLAAEAPLAAQAGSAGSEPGR